MFLGLSISKVAMNGASLTILAITNLVLTGAKDEIPIQEQSMLHAKYSSSYKNPLFCVSDAKKKHGQCRHARTVRVLDSMFDLMLRVSTLHFVTNSLCVTPKL